MEAEDIKNGVPLPRELEPMVAGENDAQDAPGSKPETATATQPIDSEMHEAPPAQNTRGKIEEEEKVEPSSRASDGFLLVEKDEAPEEVMATATNGNEESRSQKTPAKGTAVKKNSTPRTKADYNPGSLVTIKLKGYPPWPGLVVTDDFVPPSVLAQKPHPPKGKKKKEDGDEADAQPIAPHAWPVLFFADNNYMWATRPDLKLLTKEAAEAASNKGRDRQLRAAYAIAASTPSLEEAKALEPYVDDKADEMEDDEDEEKKGKKRKKIIDSDEEAELVGTKRSKSKRKSSTVGGFTAINGDDDDAPAIKRKPSSARKDKKKEGAKDAAEAREKRERDLLYLRHRLQKVFLARDKAATDAEVDNMDDILRMLENFAELDAGLIRKTKINKVLRGILRLDVVPKDEQYKFLARAQSLLASWSPMLDGVNGDEGQKEEGKEESKDQPVSDDQPNDVAMPDEQATAVPAPVAAADEPDVKEAAAVPAAVTAPEPTPELMATNGLAGGATNKEE